MSDLIFILLAGIFLPLFPASMLFNAVVEKVSPCWLKALVIIIWPLIGLYIVLNNPFSMPGWLLPLALTTSALYALRLLTLREVNQWTGFLATSMWSLLWIPVTQGNASTLLYVYAICMSVPFVMLTVLSKGLEDRFGAAYTGLYGGLARTIPNFAGILVTVIIISVATPLFPTFFIMFDLVVETIAVTPYASAMLLLIWLLWSWASARLVQGLIVGRASKVKIIDMELTSVFIYGFVLLVLFVAGVYLAGVIL